MEALFTCFSTLALVSALAVIFAGNPIHSVLFLVLTFFNGSALLVLWDLELYALLFLVVYVGAIAVLFLFVVMMLPIGLTERRAQYFPLGGLLGLLFLLELLTLLGEEVVPPLALGTGESPYVLWHHGLVDRGALELLGLHLYTHGWILVVLAGMILLVAMVGAILLTMDRGSSVARQAVFHQNTRDFTRTVHRIPS
jgi:NADH-quinone oxidoreductase subunit J